MIGTGGAGITYMPICGGLRYKILATPLGTRTAYCITHSGLYYIKCDLVDYIVVESVTNLLILYCC